jgi:serine/threonine protein kinase
MELLDGVDLESRLGELEAKGTRLSFSEVTQVLEPVVQTLHKAHGLGIVHRDLKPANIFLLKDGGVRLIDFGYARLEFESRMTHFGVIMGSPCYIAPELWLGHANTSSISVDIYSMAVLTYRMLGGHPPFETQSLVEMRELATHGERPSLHRLRPDLSEGVDDWVKKALAVEPRDRYASVRAMWEALCEAVEQPKPSSWSIIPRAVAASLHPKRVADALRRAGAVLWGRPWRESDPDIASPLVSPVVPSGAAKVPRFKPPLPPQRPRRLPDDAPDSEPMPISVIPLSVGPRSSKRAPVVLAHAAAAQGVRERHNKKKKKPRRRRATKQTRKARQGRRKARGGGR